MENKRTTMQDRTLLRIGAVWLITGLVVFVLALFRARALAGSREELEKENGLMRKRLQAEAEEGARKDLLIKISQQKIQALEHDNANLRQEVRSKKGERVAELRRIYRTLKDDSPEIANKFREILPACLPLDASPCSGEIGVLDETRKLNDRLRGERGAPARNSISENDEMHQHISNLRIGQRQEEGSISDQTRPSLAVNDKREKGTRTTGVLFLLSLGAILLVRKPKQERPRIPNGSADNQGITFLNDFLKSYNWNE